MTANLLKMLLAVNLLKMLVARSVFFTRRRGRCSENDDDDDDDDDGDDDDDDDNNNTCTLFEFNSLLLAIEGNRLPKSRTGRFDIRINLKHSGIFVIFVKCFCYNVCF